MANTPNIRFKGFHDEWEQRKFGEICEVTMGQSPDGSTYSDEPSDYILVQGNADLKDGWVFPRIWTTQKTKTAQAGDLIMSVRAPAGAMGKTAYDVVLGRGVAGIKGNEFVYQTLVKFDSDGYWKKLAAGSTFESINTDTVKGATLSIPQDVEEQEKIGHYFFNLDTLILLHQRKCDEVKQLKKFMLQKMFPKSGELIPEIRFAGFTGDWEQRKLDEWGSFYYGKSCPKWSVTEDATIPCIRYGELYTKFGAKIDRVYSYTNMSPNNLRFSKGTEVLIPRVGEDPMDYNHCTWLSMPNVAIGEMISVYNTKNNPLFTAIMFNATLRNEFAMRVEGGSVTNLYFEKLKNIHVSFPTLEEQEKISSYFENLDHLITLHQHKCDQLKEVKRFMLQNMFPQKG